MDGTSAMGTMGLFTSVPSVVTFWRTSANGATSTQAANTGLECVSSTIPACATANASPAHIQMQRFMRSSHFVAFTVVPAATVVTRFLISSFVTRNTKRMPPLSIQFAPAIALCALEGGRKARSD